MTQKSKFLCKKCSKEYIYKKSFDKHICANLKTTNKKNKFSLNKKSIKSIEINTDRTESWLPVFNFSDDFFDSLFDEEIIIPGNVTTYIDELTNFCKKNVNEIKILHLNINSVFLKIDSIHEILDSNLFDIIFLNESKLDSTVPNSHLFHLKYSLHRRDRDHNGVGIGRHGGGLLIFIRKQYIHTVESSDEFEAMHLKVTYNNTTANFLSCYKSPSINNKEFIEFLDSKVSMIDLKEPIFIVGDLNMDLNSDKGIVLNDFMRDYCLKNFVHVL